MKDTSSGDMDLQIGACSVNCWKVDEDDPDSPSALHVTRDRLSEPSNFTYVTSGQTTQTKKTQVHGRHDTILEVDLGRL